MATSLPPDSSMPPRSVQNPTAVGVVIEDTPCRKCSYNLRTLATNGNCPECGTPVGASIFGNLLRFSDPTWVGKLSQGAQYLLVGILVILGETISSVAAHAVGRATGAIQPGTHQTLFQLLSLGGSFFIAVGSWFITEPDPSGIGEDEYGTARNIIRGTCLLWVAIKFVDLASNLSTLPSTGAQLLSAIGYVSAIASVVGLIAQLQYFAKLAWRIPDPRLASRANFLKVALSATYCITILVGLVGYWGSLRPGVGTPISVVIMMSCSAIIMILATVIFGAMYLFMIVKFRRRFSEQAMLAEQLWATHSRGSGPA